MFPWPLFYRMAVNTERLISAMKAGKPLDDLVLEQRKILTEAGVYQESLPNWPSREQIAPRRNFWAVFIRKLREWFNG